MRVLIEATLPGAPRQKMVGWPGVRRRPLRQAASGDGPEAILNN